VSHSEISSSSEKSAEQSLPLSESEAEEDEEESLSAAGSTSAMGVTAAGVLNRIERLRGLSGSADIAFTVFRGMCWVDGCGIVEGGKTRITRGHWRIWTKHWLGQLFLSLDFASGNIKKSDCGHKARFYESILKGNTSVDTKKKAFQTKLALVRFWIPSTMRITHVLQ
jgi:hypothetical protein